MADQAMDDAAQAAIADAGTGALVTDDTAAQPGEGSPDASGANPQGSAPTFNPELYAFESKGQRILPKDENQARMWLSGGYNFSQSQAAFKKQQAEFEQRQARVAELEKLDELFQKNPEFQKKIFEIVQQQKQPQQPGQSPQQAPQLPPEILAKLDKVDSVSQEVQKIKEKEEDAALEQELSGLKAKYKDYDWLTDNGEGNLEKKVLQAAMDNGLSDLDKAFKIVTYDQVKTVTEAAALKRLADQTTDNAKKGIVSSSASNQKPVPKPVNHSNMSYKDLTEMAVAEMSGTT